MPLTAELAPDRFRAGRPKVCFLTGRPGVHAQTFTAKGVADRVTGRLWLSEEGLDRYHQLRSRDSLRRILLAVVSVAVLAGCGAALWFTWVEPLWTILPAALALLGLFVALARPPRSVAAHLAGTDADQVVVLRGVGAAYVAAVGSLPAPGDAPTERRPAKSKRRDGGGASATPTADLSELQELDELEDGAVDLHGRPVDTSADAERFGPADNLDLS